MAKEVAIGKRAKISEAQQYMILSVIAASVVLGVAVSLTSHFVQQIFFNAKVIAAEEQSIASYSKIIETTGVCKKPAGSVYNSEELKKCDPNSIEISQIPNTLRSNILENLAANQALNSVPKEGDSSCVNQSTGKQYTYKELKTILDGAKTAQDLLDASQLMKTCSALRIIPDALPAFRNEEALLASLNKLFITSGWEPQTISPGTTPSGKQANVGINALSINLSIEASTATTMTILHNIERSIREFNIGRATIEWGGDDTLILHAQADSYYTDPSKITESTTTIKPEAK
ncbi:hypothetical protein IKG38_00735 [Candidatus Saccharibacteria bacterium]|nr:hypothetical protein [Candidatus Saccharibacteria bacterium]